MLVEWFYHIFYALLLSPSLSLSLSLSLSILHTQTHFIVFNILSLPQDESVKYALERKTMGQPIAQHQAIAMLIADMTIGVEVRFEFR